MFAYKTQVSKSVAELLNVVSLQFTNSITMKKLLLLIAICAATNAFAQGGTINAKENSDRIPETKVDTMASFVGGNDAMMQFVQTNLKYPEAEQKANIEGVCYINFVVEKDGSLNNVKVLKGVNKGPGCDAECIRLIKSMPKWKPAKKDGKAVRVYFTLPIKFKLT